MHYFKKTEITTLSSAVIFSQVLKLQNLSVLFVFSYLMYTQIRYHVILDTEVFERESSDNPFTSAEKWFHL